MSQRTEHNKLGDFIMTIDDDVEVDSDASDDDEDDEITVQSVAARARAAANPKSGFFGGLLDEKSVPKPVAPVAAVATEKTGKQKKKAEKAAPAPEKRAFKSKWTPIDEEELNDVEFDDTKVFREPLEDAVDSDDDGAADSDEDAELSELEDDGDDGADDDEDDDEEMPEFSDDRFKAYMASVKEAKHLDGDDDDEEDDAEEARGRKKKAAAAEDDEDDDNDSLDGEDYDRSFFTDAPVSSAADNRTFDDLMLSKPILKAIEQLGYEKPTPIQARCIPLLLKGHDICASAQTGSGKTAAFMLPIIERLLLRNKKQRAIRVLILLPTRELARQCYEVSAQLAQFTDIQSCLIVGGKKVDAQKAALQTRPDIVIATPGRIVDHLLNTPSFGLETLEILVLDEADRMLEIGFEQELREILSHCPLERQTMLFSATMTDDVSRLIKLSLKNPMRVSVDVRSAVADKLRQEFIRVRSNVRPNAPCIEKEAVLLSLCTRTYRERVIIFTNYKTICRRLRMLFHLRGLKAAELHSDITQVVRLRELDRFARGEAEFLICTDVAARGLDIPDVKTVINYDMPSSLKTYIHRVGRTARAGRTGVAVSFSSEESRPLLKKIVKRAKARKEEVQQRVIPAEAMTFWRAKIEGLEPKLADLQLRIKMEQELKEAYEEIQKAERKLQQDGKESGATGDGILSRPKHQWIDREAIRKQVEKEFESMVDEEKKKIKGKNGGNNNKKRKRDEKDEEEEEGRQGGKKFGKKQPERKKSKRDPTESEKKRDERADQYLQKFYNAKKAIKARRSRYGGE